MTATKDFKLPKAPANAINFFMGTNANGKHLEEAMRQQIVAPDERLLGFFDGIFFEPNGKRIGGLALHDYLIVTDRHLTLWARDQFKDYVDRFPLAASFVRSCEQKDVLHGTLQLACQLTSEADDLDGLDGPSEVEITFDFVPLADLKQIGELIELVGNVHRDLTAGGAGPKDRYDATWLLFNQVFVGNSTPVGSKPATAPTSGSAHHEPLVEVVHEDDLADLMTPLSRLDKLDGVSANRVAPATRPTVSLPRRGAEVNYAAADGGEIGDEKDLADLEAELRWLNAAQGATRPGPQSARTAAPDLTGSVGPGTRLKQDLNPEGLYNIGRAGRAAWDGLDKLRREAESKVEARGANLLPMLNTLRESGMNLKDITEFVVAINGLLDTLNHSPAAYELAMNFVNRSSFMSGLGGLGGSPAKSRKPIPKVEDIMDEGEELTGSARVVGSPKTARPQPTAKSADPFNPTRYKVAIRKRNSEAPTDEGTITDGAATHFQPVNLDETSAPAIRLFDRSEESTTETAHEDGSPLFKPRPTPVSIRTVQVRSSGANNN